MITPETVSGNIIVNPLENKGFSIVLDNFVGTIDVSKSVHYIQFNIKGDCKVNSDVILKNHDNLDHLLFRGSGSLEIGNIEATSISIQSSVSAISIVSNVTKLNCSNLTRLQSNSVDTFITATGHIWLTDSILSTSNTNNGISTPYLLIDNCKCSINASDRAINSDNPQVIEHCTITKNTKSNLTCKPEASDSKGNPIRLVQYKSENGLITRRETYSYSPAYTPLSEKDKFREYIGYTNPDLHRRIDQDGEYESPSVEPDKYEIGIRGIYSYRGTNKTYHEEKSPYDETP